MTHDRELTARVKAEAEAAGFARVGEHARERQERDRDGGAVRWAQRL